MLIKYVLASRVHNPHYLTKYINFITRCQNKNESYNGYTERHHICPKSEDMFPEFASFTEFPWNCAILTPRQHYIAHLMLYKIYNNYTSQAAYQAMKSTKYKTRTQGNMTVKDALGNTFNTSNKDPRFLSGELTHICKGKVSVKDAVGNTFQVDKNDSRYLSEELVFICTGIPSVNRLLSSDQVKEIKLAMVNPASVITKDYLIGIVRKSDIDKIDKIPIEELRYVNGKRLSYRLLLARYYADKFKVSIPIITYIIDGKTYKNIVI